MLLPISIPITDNAINTPISVVQHIVDKNHSQLRGEVYPPIMLQLLLDGVTQLACKLKEDTKQQKDDFIKNVWEMWKPTIPNFFDNLETLNEMRADNDNELLQATQRLFDATHELIIEVCDRVNGQAIDEDSEDYNNFMIDLAENANQSARYYGTETLMEILQD